MLPPLREPRILDIGCGTGVPTLELARMTDGEIVALDIDQSALDKLARRVASAGFADRVTIACRSLKNMGFPSNSFDIVWAEGSVAVIGFERGLREWRELLVPEGFLVIHDDLSDRDRKLACVTECGYELLGEFTLPEEVWWKEYYEPMRQYIQALPRSDRGDPALSAEIKNAKREIEEFGRGVRVFGSFYAIMQKHL